MTYNSLKEILKYEEMWDEIKYFVKLKITVQMIVMLNP